MSGIFGQYPSAGGSGGSGGLSSVSFSIGTLDGGTPNQNGASVSSNSIFLESAGPTFPGLVNSGSQTFSGVKTFNTPPNLSSLSPNSQLSLDGSGNMTVSSVNLTSQVTGVLPLANMTPTPLNSLTATTGSISLTGQVVGILPAGNLPPLSSIAGSVSLTTQVSGVLPFTNMTPLLVGALGGANASAVNGAVIGTNSLFLQAASIANNGLVVVASTQSFTGLKNFTQVGINNTSGNAGLFVVSSGLATNSLTIQGLSGQTSLGLNIVNSAGVPAVVYDFNQGSFRFFVAAQEAAECNFDNRANVVTASINSGSAARFNLLCAQQSAIAAGTGGGIAFGATTTGTTTVTEYGYIWATKNNANAGDDDGSLHFATRSNATGKAQRALDMDQGGNSTFYGTVNHAGATSGAITFSVASAVTAYGVTYPSSFVGNGTCLKSIDGVGTMSWGVYNLNCVVLNSLGSTTWTTPVSITTSTLFKITVVGGGGSGGNAIGLFGCGGGGGGGGTIVAYQSGVAASTIYTYSIGVGGPVGSGSSSSGVSGSQTSFSLGGTNYVAGGGAGGAGSSGGGVGPTFGGVGGSTTTAGTVVSVRGGAGGPGMSFASVNGAGGAGGGSYFSGQTTNAPSSVNGVPGSSPGQGGGGANSSSASTPYSGGAGANGLIIIEWIS
jgi:hypothetical protein